MNQPRKNTKLFKMLTAFKGKQFSYGEMVRFACELNGRDYDVEETYQNGFWSHTLGKWVPTGSVLTRRANRGYWSVNIRHAKDRGYIVKNSRGTYTVADWVVL